MDSINKTNDLKNIIKNEQFFIIMIIIIFYFLNIKFGIFCSIIFILVYLLNYNKTNYNIIKKNLILKEMEDPKKIEKILKCRPATLDNPYANYLIGETANLSACKDQNNLNKSSTFNSFNVYENANDIHIGSTNKMYRNFYTTTITKNINDTNKFAKWLYLNNNLSCKTDNNCLIYDDVRYHSR